MRTIKPTGERRIVSLDEALRRVDAYEIPEPDVTPIDTDEKTLAIRDVKCVSPNYFDVKEEYPVLHIAKDIARLPNGQMIRADIDYATNNLKGRRGGFLPSLPLTCNIVAKLYKNRGHPDAKKLLMNYKERLGGHEWGICLQNTIVDHSAYKIVHYPNMRETLHNISPRHYKTFTAHVHSVEGVISLQEALGNSPLLRFLQDLTCLPDPTVLKDIAKYFGVKAHIFFPKDRSDHPVRQCRFGFIGDLLAIDTSFKEREAYRWVQVP